MHKSGTVNKIRNRMCDGHFCAFVRKAAIKVSLEKCFLYEQKRLLLAQGEVMIGSPFHTVDVKINHVCKTMHVCIHTLFNAQVMFMCVTQSGV